MACRSPVLRSCRAIPAGAISVLENPDRQQLGQSFYFALPADWLNGTVDLELRLPNRTLGCREIASTANDCKAQVSFSPAPAPDLRFVGVTWEQTGVVHAPSQADLSFAQRQIASIFPVPQVNATFGSNLDVSYLGGPPRTQLDFIEINTMLDVNRMLDGCINSGLEGCKTFYLGVLIDRPVAVSASGWALNSPPSFIATAYLSDPFVLPHELAAATGQKHTLCAGDEDLPTQIYPYSDGKISQATSGDDAYYGFDVNTRLVYSPEYPRHHESLHAALDVRLDVREPLESAFDDLQCTCAQRAGAALCKRARAPSSSAAS